MKNLVTVLMLATWAGMALGQAPPKLSESEELQRNLWAAKLLSKGDKTAQETLLDVHALLNHPANFAVRNALQPDQMKFLVESAIFARRIAKGEPQLPFSEQLLNDHDLVFPKWPQLADTLKLPLEKMVAEKAQGWVQDKTTMAARNAVENLLDRHPAMVDSFRRGLSTLNKLSPMVPMVDQAMGDQYAKTLAQAYGANLTTLQNARLAARLTPNSQPELIEVLGRLVASAKTDPLARAILTDVNGLDFPNKPEAELRRDPDWAGLLQVVDALKGPRTAKKQEVIRRFLQTSDPTKTRSLATKPPRAKASESATSTPAEIDTPSAKEQLKERIEDIRQAEQAVGLTIDILAKLGADPKFVRDMHHLNKAGAQVAVGVAKACTNVYNPIGWITIAHGICQLFSVGPTTDELILERLALILKEVREFRTETRRELARLRDDLRVNVETTLGRLDDLEYSVASHHGVFNGKLDGVHYRLYASERRLESMCQATRNRFAEAAGRSWISTINRLYLDPRYYSKLDASGDNLLKTRYHDDVSLAILVADHHAKSLTLSGGDAQGLAALAQTNSWLTINDLLGLVGRRERVVNPEVWGQGADLLTQLAMAAPETFKSNPRYREALAKVYVAGEQFNDALRLAPEALEPLMKRREDNLKAALEEVNNRTSKLTETVGLNPFNSGQVDCPQLPKFLGLEPSVVEGLEKAGFPVDSAQGPLPMTDMELRLFFERKVIPEAFFKAARINPMTGRGEAQDYFGGRIEIAIVEISPQIDDKSPFIKFRGSRRESTGFLGTGPGQYYPYYLYEGPLIVTAEIRYRTNRQAEPWTIRREKVPTQTVVRILRENKPNGGDPSRTFTYTPEGFKLALEICEGRGPVLLTLHTGFGPGNNNTWEFNVVADPTWRPLGENRWFARVISHDSAVSVLKMPTGPITGRDVQNKLRFVGRAGWGSQREFSGLPSVQYPLLGKEECKFVEFVAKQWAQVKTDLLAQPTPEEPTAGILSANLVNEAVQRRLKYERQAFSDGLAREEADSSTPYGRCLSDEKRLSILITRLARLSGFKLVETRPFSDSESAAPEQKDIPAEIEKLRLMIVQAQRLHDSIRSQPPANNGPHSAVAARLIRLTLTARSLDIDLIDELKRIGVTAPPHWVAAQQPLVPTK